MTIPDLEGYEAAQTEAVYFPHEAGGYLQVVGEDRVAFLQRQTSNDVRKLGENQANLTVLTSPTARILDVFYLLQQGDAIDVITLPGRGVATASFLKSRIFFNDKVAVHNFSEQVFQADILGPKAGQVLGQLGASSLPEAGSMVTFDHGEAHWHALGLQPPLGMGYRLLVAADERQLLEEALAKAGCERLSPQAYLVLRIEAGQPEAGYELTDAYTPLEVGLEGAISGDKGCYTGQEIIARQVTYDKVTQKLRGVRLDRTVEPGDKVRVEGKPAGTITSSAESPRFGFIALAVLRRPHNETGTKVQVGNVEGQVVTGVVTDLPFA